MFILSLKSTVLLALSGLVSIVLMLGSVGMVCSDAKIPV